MRSATEAAARSTPDGYTFLLTPGATLTVLPLLRKVNYDASKDFVPVADVGDLVCGFVIVPSLGINSIKELVDYAKKNPGKLAFRLCRSRHVFAHAHRDAEAESGN